MPSTKDWSYGYKGTRETRTVLITNHVATYFGEGLGRKIHFQGPPIRTLEDMTQQEIAALESEYGCSVKAKRYEWGIASERNDNGNRRTD